MNKKNIKVGSRGSRLALVQVDEIRFLLNAKGIDVDLDLVTYETKGDKDKQTPLTENLADDFFTDTLDEALLDKDVDITINSAKDLPDQMRAGLSIYALTASPDTTDAFVGKVPFKELKAGAKVGASSEVRKKGIKELNPGIEVVDIRGTIEERIQLIEQGFCDGVIVATVALKRLGLQHHIKDIMPWAAHPLQGQLAVVGRKDNASLKKIFSSINTHQTSGILYTGTNPQKFKPLGRIVHHPMIQTKTN